LASPKPKPEWSAGLKAVQRQDSNPERKADYPDFGHARRRSCPMANDSTSREREYGIRRRRKRFAICIVIRY